MRDRSGQGWLIGVVVAAVAAFALVLVPASPARAHPPGIQPAVDYRVTVTGVTPVADGVAARFVDDGSRLELRSTGRSVEILGYEGEVMLRVGPDGAWQNTRSPSLYVDQPGGAAKAGASAQAEPNWQRISDRPLVRWLDHRAAWHGSAPPQVRADPHRVHRVSEWQVRVRVDTVPGEINGVIDWVPPPSPGGWWLAMLLLFAGVTAAGALWRRRQALARGVLVAAGLSVGGAAVVYQVLVAGHNAEPGAGAFALALLTRPAELLTGLALCVVAVAMLAGHTGLLILLFFGGPATAFLAGLRNLALLSHAVAPVAVDPMWARLVEVVILGGGAGLLGAGIAYVGLSPQRGPRPLPPG